MHKRPQLVIFDCDGVLVDSEELVNDLESECFKRFGIDIPPRELNALFKGKTISDMREHLTASAHQSLPADWMYEWAMSVALGFTKHLRAVEGVAAAVTAVKGAGIKTCVASQSPYSRVRLSLHVTGLDADFQDAVFCASMVEHPKPAPDLFLYAARKMGADARNSVVIEDSPLGAAAAKAAGMRVLGYSADGTDARALAHEGADVFSNMTMLPALIGIEAEAL